MTRKSVIIIVSILLGLSIISTIIGIALKDNEKYKGKNNERVVIIDKEEKPKNEDNQKSNSPAKVIIDEKIDPVYVPEDDGEFIENENFIEDDDEVIKDEETTENDNNSSIDNNDEATTENTDDESKINLDNNEINDNTDVENNDTNISQDDDLENQSIISNENNE